MKFVKSRSPQLLRNFTYFNFFLFQNSPLFASLKKELGGVESTTRKSLRTLALFGAGVSGLLSFATISSCDEAEHGLEAANYPWPHAGILSSYDHAS